MVYMTTETAAPDTYRIVFTQQTTMATCFSPAVPDGGKVYYLKAKNKRSAQHVGYAAVVKPGLIEVPTCSGAPVGTASTRVEAARMIDSYHRENNRRDYWIWADKKLAN